MNAVTTAPRNKEVEQDVFRQVVGHFASGVTVITTSENGTLSGTTASAVSSLSMEPPMMLVCLNTSSATHDVVKRTGIFGINILAEGQGDLAIRFAKRGIEDRFAGVAHRVTEDGVPLIDGALATIECETVEVARGGTHTVFLARVLDAASSERQPLTYYRGSFGRLDSVQEHDVYLRVREWALSRPIAPGEPIDEVALGAELGADAAYIENALIRLMTESLVARDDNGDLALVPVTSEFIDQAVDGRTAILIGVLDRHMHKATAADLAELRALAGEVTLARTGSEASLDGFLRAADAFHRKIVSIAGSQPLMNAYARLGMSAVWRPAFGAEDPARMKDTELTMLAEAVVAQRYDDARRAAYAHGDMVKELARSVIAERGGSL